MGNDEKPSFNVEEFRKLYSQYEQLADNIDAIVTEVIAEGQQVLKGDKGIEWDRMEDAGYREKYVEKVIEAAKKKLADSGYSFEMKGYDPKFVEQMTLQQFLGINRDQLNNVVRQYKSNWKQYAPNVLGQAANRAKQQFESVPRGLVRHEHIDDIIGKVADSDIQDGINRELDDVYQLLVEYTTLNKGIDEPRNISIADAKGKGYYK